VSLTLAGPRPADLESGLPAGRERLEQAAAGYPDRDPAKTPIVHAGPRARTSATLVPETPGS